MRKSTPDDGLMSIEQVCSRYKVTRWTVHRWVREGLLTPTKVVRRTYFTPNAITTFERRWCKQCKRTEG